MSERQKYRKVIGEIASLKDDVSWTTGLMNLVDWLTWEPKRILGISKADFMKKVLVLADDESVRYGPMAERLKYVREQCAKEQKASAQEERYAPISNTLAKPREALRRIKFFSEDYLNKEFDIFLSLCSDLYLDTFYAQFATFEFGGQWAVHGNGDLFKRSTEIREMQMDNVAYNHARRLLVANELKLGGKKNADQILKYGLMLRILKQRGFVHADTQMILLFLGDTEITKSWDVLIEEEYAYCCRENANQSAARLIEPANFSAVQDIQFATTTWLELVDFNTRWIEKLDTSQQVEQKLLKGFNETLRSKFFMQPALK